MTPYERVMAVLSGRKPDRIPVFPWVRDWCAVQADFGIVDILENTEKHVYSQYFARKTFGYDAVFDLFGVNGESEAMGTINRYDNGTPLIAVDHPIKDYDRDLPNLKMLNPHKDGRLPQILEGARRLKELCRGDVPVIGYVQGALRHATLLRGADRLLRDMYKKPERLKELLEVATQSLIIYGSALSQTGVDIIMVSDPSSSGDLISRKQWERWGLPGNQRLIKALKMSGVKVIFHICGDTTDRLDTFAHLSADCISLDQKVDLAKAREVLGNRCCIYGNVSTTDALSMGTPEAVEEEAKTCIEKAGRSGPFILGTGCVVPMSVKPENMRALIRAALEYG